MIVVARVSAGIACRGARSDWYYNCYDYVCCDFYCYDDDYCFYFCPYSYYTTVIASLRPTEMSIWDPCVVRRTLWNCKRCRRSSPDHHEHRISVAYHAGAIPCCRAVRGGIRWGRGRDLGPCSEVAGGAFEAGVDGDAVRLSRRCLATGSAKPTDARVH